MELYNSEEQQVEAIKEWLREHGKAVLVGVVIGLGGLFGWNYYQHTVTTAQEKASDDYVAVMSQVANKESAEAATDIQAYIAAHSKSEYATLAALQLAKIQVEDNKLDDAVAQLKTAQQSTQDAALKSLLSYRIARIEAELEHYDAASSELATITDKSWAGRVAELRGDIALRQGNKEAAYAAYTEAQQAGDANQSLKMKLDDLAK